MSRIFALKTMLYHIYPTLFYVLAFSRSARMKNLISKFFFWKFVFTITTAKLFKNLSLLPLHLEIDCLINIVSSNSRPPQLDHSKKHKHIPTRTLSQNILALVSLRKFWIAITSPCKKATFNSQLNKKEALNASYFSSSQNTLQKQH